MHTSITMPLQLEILWTMEEQGDCSFSTILVRLAKAFPERPAEVLLQGAQRSLEILWDMDCLWLSRQHAGQLRPLLTQEVGSFARDTVVQPGAGARRWQLRSDEPLDEIVLQLTGEGIILLDRIGPRPE